MFTSKTDTLTVIKLVFILTAIKKDLATLCPVKQGLPIQIQYGQWPKTGFLLSNSIICVYLL